MEESCLFLLCVRNTQTFFIISPLYRFQQAFFDKESVLATTKISLQGPCSNTWNPAS